MIRSNEMVYVNCRNNIGNTSPLFRSLPREIPMKNRCATILFSLFTLWISVGCVPRIGPEIEPIDPMNDNAAGSETETFDAPSGASTAVSPTADPRTIRQTPAPPANIEALPATAVPSVIEEIPEAIMTAVFEDLETVAAVQRAAIDVTQSEAIVWQDGSLGCPLPGQVYSQSPVNGYRIVLEANGRVYNYHVAETGYFVLCQNSQPAPIDGTPIS